MTIGEVLEPRISDVKLIGCVELVGQPDLCRLDLAVHTPVGGIGVDVEHDSILGIDLVATMPKDDLESGQGPGFDLMARAGPQAQERTEDRLACE